MSEHEKSYDAAVAGSGGDESALVSRVRVIEDQPLESRAAAFVQVHDELQAMLEGAEPRDR